MVSGNGHTMTTLDDAAPPRPRAAVPDLTRAAAWPSLADRLPLAVPVVLSVLLTAGLLSLLFVRNHRYFYIDDRIAETVPKFIDIGRLLLDGHWPWLSTNIVNGGGYAIEYLNGVFNPVNLLLCVVFALSEDVALASFIYVLVHCSILAGAGAWLGRTLGASTAWSVALGVSLGFHQYTIVWNATAWSQGLISFAWFALAVAAAAAFHFEPRRRYGWLLLFATYSCLTSGWPLAVFVLGAFVAALALGRLVARMPLGGTVWLCVWFGAGVLCSLVAIFPLLTSFEVASRHSGIENVANFNVTPLEGLLQFANPAYYGFFHNWGGYSLQRLPHFYAAWFVLPVLVFLRSVPCGRAEAAFGIAVSIGLGLAVVLALGPERFLVFRFPNRALQFVHFFLIAGAVLLVRHGRFAFTWRRLAVLAALLAVMLLTTLQADPTGLRRAVNFGAAVFGLILLVWAAGAFAPRRADAAGSRPLAALADQAVLWGTVALLAKLALAHPSGRGVDWGFPHDIAGLKPVSARDYTLFYGNYFPPVIPPSAYDEFRFSTTGLAVGDRQVNGYSSLGNRHLKRHFPLDDQGNFAPGAAAAFTAVDPETGLQFLELLRVDQVIALFGEMEEDLRPRLGPAWRRERAGAVAAVYAHAPYTLPGLVSFASPGLRLGAEACERTPSRECIRIEDTGPGGRLVFARLWLPGYHARLDGEPLPVHRHADFLVAVDVPPGGSGTLTLIYRSPGFRLFGGLGLLTVLGLGLATTLGRRWPGLVAGTTTGRPVRRRAG